MWLNIILIILCIAIVVEYKKTAVINHMGHIRFLRGIPNLEDGSDVTMNFCNNQIVINDDLIIPLEKVKSVTSFKVKQITMADKGLKRKAEVNLPWIKRAETIIHYLITAKNVTLLSIVFINDQGFECKGLFVTNNNAYLKEFADVINKKIGLVVTGQVIS